MTLKSTTGKPARYPRAADSTMPFSTAGMKFFGIDVVVAAVVEDDFKTDEGEAGEISAPRRSHDALLDCGDKVFWDGPAEDVVLEDEAAAARHGFHLDLAVAELPVSAGLLLVA